MTRGPASSREEAKLTRTTVLARLALADALDHLEIMQARGLEVTEQVDQMVKHHGASVRFVNGTNVFRCAGVTGTSTADKGALMLASWSRIADRNLGTSWPKGGPRPNTPKPDPLTLSLSKGVSPANGFQPSAAESTANG
ncbi:MAG TPA: hypothetical protein PK823_00955 [Novosphingobium sp.]|nr:hypothetical protein [Novosphingobium sp.]